ncbi:MAG: hypothetical protein ACREPD_15625 [Stenotrophomonas sp.]|uniref:hypothetical protein n=1 Tax=Gammaproteobacteria TaxID=1236 RepID=UPI003D6D81C9
MLPPDFRWHAVGTATFAHPNSLLLDCVEVARLYQRVGEETWWVSLNSQRPTAERKCVLCSGYEQGMAGVEVWAERHHARLREEVDRYLQQLQAARAARKR